MSKKNLIFVFADQWRGSAMGLVGNDDVITPNMDEFCQDATTCDHMFSTFPLCSPARASLITGKYPLSAGFYTNCKNGIDLRLQDDEIGIGQALKSDGYQTAYIGKWHLDEPETNHTPNPISGARNWDAYTPEGVRRHGFDYWYVYNAYDNHFQPHYWHNSPEMIQKDQWSVEHETDKAIEYLEEKRDPKQPFALYVSYNPPHSPYKMVPDKYLDKFRDKQITLRDNVTTGPFYHHTGEEGKLDQDSIEYTTKEYYAAVNGIDDNFGRLVQYLKDNGLYEDTIIVLTADHGDMMGSHGLLGKHVWYEESIRVPLVFRIPGNKKRLCETNIASQDIMPTILGLLGTPIPETVEGEDRSEFLVEDTEDYSKESFICACPGRDIFIEKFREHGLDPREFGWRGVRTHDYKYVMELGYDVVKKPNTYLFNLKEDPYENHPLDLTVKENQDLAKDLEARVVKWLEEQNDGFLKQWKEK